MTNQLNSFSHRIEQLQKELQEIEHKYQGLYGEMEDKFIPSLSPEDTEHLLAYVVPMKEQLEKHQANIQLLLDENKRMIQLLSENKKIIAQLLENQEEERQYVADHVLDSIFQVLYSCMLAMKVLKNEPISHESNEYLNSLKDVLERELDKLKIAALHLYPTSLSDLGILGATKHYYTFLKNKNVISFNLQIKGQISRYEPKLEIKLFRLIEYLLLLLNKIPHGDYTLKVNEHGEQVIIILTGEGIKELDNLPEFSWIYKIVQCISSVHFKQLNSETVSINIQAGKLSNEKRQIR